MSTFDALAARLRALYLDLDAAALECVTLDATVASELHAHAGALLALSETVGKRLHLDPLPPGMARVLAHVRQFIHAHGFPPTRQEIADALGFTSATGAHDHLKRLAQRGLITLIEGQARGIRLNKRTLSARSQT